MVFTRFVEIGRVVLVNGGPHKGKLAVIVDVIDMGRALVDGPSTAARFGQLLLTDFKIPLTVSARTTRVKKAFDEAEIQQKWDASAWAKRLARRDKRASLNDFERFIVKVNKIKRSRIVNTALSKINKKSPTTKEIKAKKAAKAGKAGAAK